MLVLDLDVHQGDGTATIFHDDPSVLTVSVHCKDNFPFEKAASDVDVALPSGTGDAEYLEMLRGLLPSLIRDFRPTVVCYDAGVDVAADDGLGRFALTAGGIRARDRYVLETLVLDHAIPTMTVIGGGYIKARDAASQRLLAARHAICVEEAVRIVDLYSEEQHG